METHDELGAAVALAVLLVIPVWRIFRRAGLHPALSLLLFIPGLGVLIVSVVLAFSRWPAVEGPADRRES
jgi:hypothetical protein